MNLPEPSVITSPLLAARHKAWVDHAVSGSTSDCLLFLDAEIYIERVKAPEIVRGLQKTGGIPPITSVYLSYLDTAARHANFTCNETYSRFVATDLCNWIQQAVCTYKRIFLCGLSLSALCAAFTALRRPDVFSGVLSQSPSAWWNDEWLAASLTGASARPAPIWLSVGDQEVQENISHPPTGLFQNTSQLDSVRRLAETLTACGGDVRYNEFHGGHDPRCWADELPQALAWLIQDSLGNSS